MREFAAVTARIAADGDLLRELVTIVENEDDKGFNKVVTRLKLQRYHHQLLSLAVLDPVPIRLQVDVPTPPLITKVAHIPTNQIDTQGYGAGPSIPPGHTPNDNKPQGEGDHPSEERRTLRATSSRSPERLTTRSNTPTIPAVRGFRSWHRCQIWH